ncbi:ABC transporter substrate-binding protein [Paraglaciecola sp.]|uniref:ABC transporter substrate-binding protein n=1 Tax=Paraglaciecola sp. TaxID=1920173 RepID=UPI003EF7B2E5
MPKLIVQLVIVVVALNCKHNLANENLSKENLSKESKRLMVLLPEGSKRAFWQNIISYMNATASNLGIEITVHFFEKPDKNRYQISASVSTLLNNQKQKPDMIVSTFSFLAEDEILNTLNPLEIPLITFNTSIPDNISQIIGQPREKYPYWLAHISPDDISVGSQLAHYLINSIPAKEKNMIGLGGLQFQSTGLSRSLGLRQAAQNNRDTFLVQEVAIDWNAKEAQLKTKVLLNRHKNINIIWAAADNMVEGAIQAISSHFPKLIPGKDIWLGGVDWSTSAVKNIESNKQLVSYGGHFVEGGIAIILLYDYLNGLDFIDDTGVTLKTKLAPMTKDNVEHISKQLLPSKWTKIDFKQFTKTHNPAQKNYDLAIERLLNISTVTKKH